MAHAVKLAQTELEGWRKTLAPPPRQTAEDAGRRRGCS
jgi:hypothetical protein